MRNLHVVPNDSVVIHDWAETFTACYGVLPIGGGETPGGGAAVATPPAAPAQPAAAPTPTPPPGQAAAPAPAGEPAAPAEGEQPAAEAAPAWAQPLLERMDQLAPPASAAPDPLLVELGMAPAQPQPSPGQPQVDPTQQMQAAGQQMPGGLPPLGQAAQPVQPPGQVPGQQVPGQVDPTEQLVHQLIDGRARDVVSSVLQESLVPYLQQQQAVTRRNEFQAVIDDHPELKDQARFNEVAAQARAWARETLGNESYASEPGYFETVLLAMKAYEGGQQPGQPAAVNPGGGETPIEGAGGANPAPAQSQADQLGDQIVQAKPGGGLNDLWR